jgi:hypothetical protein
MKNSKNFFAKTVLFIAMLAFVAIPAISYADTFNLTLKVGSRNSEVTALQSFLGIGADGIFGRILQMLIAR